MWYTMLLEKGHDILGIFIGVVVGVQASDERVNEETGHAA